MDLYEQKYNDALERARKLCDVADTFTSYDINTIFPELQESYGEMIRKELIEHIKANKETDYVLFKKFSPDDVIAWLEKQGKQKSTDKTEPKFKVGDWIVGAEGIFKVIRYEDEYGYELIAPTGCVAHFISPDYVESNYHLWTIQDAKNGDVLITMSNKYPFLYKDCLDPNHPESPVAYCGIDDEGDFCIGRRAYWWTDEEVQPATKEQHDLLFQKMKEAGYEWNSGKKALKKIDNEEFNGED